MYTESYREEDAGAVEAMHRLVLQARETGCRWSALPAEARNVSEAEHRAFWVAVPLANGMPEIIGTVGLRIVGDSRSADADSVESSGLPSAEPTQLERTLSVHTTNGPAFPESTSSPNLATAIVAGRFHLPDGMFDQTTSNATTSPTFRYCEPANPILRSIGSSGENNIPPVTGAPGGPSRSRTQYADLRSMFRTRTS